MKTPSASILASMILGLSAFALSACGDVSSESPSASASSPAAKTTTSTVKSGKPVAPPSGASAAPGASADPFGRDGNSEDEAKAILAMPADPKADRGRRAFQLLTNADTKTPVDQVKMLMSISGEGIPPDQKARLLFDGMLVKDTLAAGIVKKVCGENAEALQDEVKKGKPEEASAIVSKKCHLEALVPAGDVHGTNPWFLLAAAVFSEELKQAGASESVVSAAKLLAYLAFDSKPGDEPPASSSSAKTGPSAAPSAPAKK